MTETSGREPGHALRLVQITDLHVVDETDNLTSGEVLVESLHQLVREARPDLIVASGDLTNRGTRRELEILKEALQSAGCPVYPLFAGHDGNEERKETGAPGTTWTRNWEAAIGPAYRSFDQGGQHFVLYPTEEGYFSPADQERKRQWLEDDLAAVPPGTRTTVVVHTPPTGELVEYLAQRGVGLILFGHWHSTKVYRHSGVVVAATPPLCFGGIDTSPRSYRVVDYPAEGDPALSLRSLGGPTAGPAVSAPAGAGCDLVWETTIPGGVHRAAMVAAPGERLLVSLRDEDDGTRAGVMALDAATGAEQWRTSAEASVKNRVALVDDERAAALTVTGQLCVLSVRDGSPLWQARLPGHPERWLFTAPTADEGRVYAGGKAGYGAHEADTGAPLWYTPLESSDNWSCYAGPHRVDDLLVCPVQRRGVVALDAGSGAVRWEQPAVLDYQFADPVVAGGTVYTGVGGGQLVALQVADGAEVWRVDLEAPYPAGLAVDGERLYATTPDGQVQARDAADGHLLWSTGTGPDILDLTPYRRGICSSLAAPAPLGDRVAVGANDGALYLLEASTGQVCERLDFGSPVSVGATALADGFCVGVLDGRVARYQLS